MNKFAKIALMIGVSVSSLPTFSQDLYQIDYKGFTIWLDCNTKSAVGWKYIARKDTGNYDRYNSFFRDPNLPTKCSQTSTNSYKTGKGQIKYHRGHLVPANAMDYSDLTIKQSNIMTNILPQVAQMNTGAWKETEVYVECRRDKYPITVVGGVFDGNTPINGDFKISHGIQAPEAFWKVAYSGNQAIAWWIPNSPLAKSSMIDSYIVTPKQIEKRIGREIDVPIFLKNKRATETNASTSYCKRS